MIGFPTGVVDVVRSTDMISLIDAVGGNGVHNGITVTANGSGLGVNVSAGAYTANGTKVQYAGASPAVTLTAADATNPRYDIITADSSGVIAKVDGTAAAVPQYPAIPAGKIRLAIIYIRPTAALLVASDIFDGRFIVPISSGSATINSNTAVIVNDRAVKTNSTILLSMRGNPGWAFAHSHSINASGSAIVYNIEVSTDPKLIVNGGATGVVGINSSAPGSQYVWYDNVVDGASFIINVASTVSSLTFDYIIMG